MEPVDTDVVAEVSTRRRRALVTGGDGFAGRYLVERLVRADWVVDTLDLRRGHDIRNYETVRSFIEYDHDAVFHLAAQAYTPEGDDDPQRAIDVNVSGTLNVLEAVRSTGSHARVLLAGTSGEYGLDQLVDEVTEEMTCWPTQVYGVTKLAATHLGLVYARRYGIPVVVTRAYNHTGPGRPACYAESSFAYQVAEVEAGRRAFVEHGNLDSGRDFLDVRDVVRGYEALIGAPTGVYNLCSGRVVTLREVLDILIGHARCVVPTREVHGRFRADDLKFHRTSYRRAFETVGWSPEAPLERTLGDLLDHWRGVM